MENVVTIYLTYRGPFQNQHPCEKLHILLRFLILLKCLLEKKIHKIDIILGVSQGHGYLQWFKKSIIPFN